MSHLDNWPRKKRKKDDSEVATSVNYVFASFLSWIKSICNPEMAMYENYSLQRLLLPPFGGEHLDWKWTSRLAPLSPKAKPRGSHMVGWIHPIHLDTPTMLGWTKNQVLGRSPIWGLFQPKSISTLGQKGKLSKRPLKGSKHAIIFFNAALPHRYLLLGSSYREGVRNIPWMWAQWEQCSPEYSLNAKKNPECGRSKSNAHPQG